MLLPLLGLTACTKLFEPRLDYEQLNHAIEVGEFEPTRKKLDDYLKTHPTDITALKEKAYLLTKMGQDAEASKSYDIAIKLDPQDYESYLQRGTCEEVLKQYDAAIKDLTVALTHLTGRTKIPVYINRSDTYTKMGRTEEAIADCNAALAEPVKLSQFEEAILYGNRAEAYQKAKKIDRAIVDFRKSLKHDPRGVGGSIQYHLSECLQATGQKEEAAKLLTASVELGFKPSDVEFVPAGEDKQAEKVQAQFSTRYDTAHFLFYSDLPLPLIKHYGELCETIFDYVNEKLCKARGPFPIKIYMLKDRAEYNTFMQKNSFFEGRSIGFFFGTKNAIIADEASGTLPKEIVRKLLIRRFPQIDSWAVAGISALFDPVYAYRTSLGPEVFFGFRNPTRLKDLGSTPDKTSLRSIVERSQRAAPTNLQTSAEEWLLAQFLREQKKLDDYLKQVSDSDKAEFNTYLEAAFKLPLEKIEPRWKAFLDSAAKVQNAAPLPSSRLFASPDEYMQFAKAVKLQAFMR